jgi:chromatin remodeling complex protein RSC6
MPRVKKSETSTETVAVAAVPVANAPKMAKAPKQSQAVPATPKAAVTTPVVAEVAAPKAKKVKVAAAAAPEAPVAVVDPSAEAVATLASPIAGDFTDFMGKLQQLSTLFSAIKTEFRTLEKKASRELKSATKASAKRKRKTGNRSPSGFVKPTLISADLATFLGKAAGTEMARTEVTREINAYIRANSLQDKTNGRKINADAKLSTLLKIDTTKEDLTYFNLQRYMSPHFFKAAAPVATA